MLFSPSARRHAYVTLEKLVEEFAVVISDFVHNGKNG